ncbi:hypothetical protein R75461_01125 [Paraburkholderia nemoris]|uniref:hypothetical protein n=1 Tax=Paraburkholderia nemoris TaxID=2793076 RepID=UPI001B0128D8|nr:hypothetical protein [Paraburkholderia nemoris]CAE6712555.1 hypothetical protein R75461_01125 [Paraburkholderia nemoris]
MTLPTGSLSMSQIAAELGLSLPLSLQHSWVRALAQVGGAACDFNSLRGKTGTFNGGCPSNVPASFITFPGNPPWFGGTLSEMDAFAAGQGNQFQLNFASAPNWSGNIRVTNQTTGISALFNVKASSTQWQATPFQANLIRSNVTDTFLIRPSS